MEVYLSVHESSVSYFPINAFCSNKSCRKKKKCIHAWQQQKSIKKLTIRRIGGWLSLLRSEKYTKYQKGAMPSKVLSFGRVKLAGQIEHRMSCLMLRINIGIIILFTCMVATRFDGRHLSRMSIIRVESSITMIRIYKHLQRLQLCVC